MVEFDLERIDAYYRIITSPVEVADDAKRGHRPMVFPLGFNRERVLQSLVTAYVAYRLLDRRGDLT